ncbi:TRAP-type transport system periplasmic substrate-binding protein (plasmid) [Haloferax gibbonsii]|uniref:TRAP-type transport system periplasmic substrate-binding protein n=2 Tax=Haloferax gibbonsii TaxID=35746 RepID=A0A871BLF4_HALGI|nr:TRAP-type transport system periplasmic substrate-binding protein [Haloferax gibbonsii]
MHSRRQVVKKMGAATTVAGLTSIAGCSTSSGSTQTTLRFNVPTNEKSIQGKIPAWLKETVEEKTGGDIELDLYYNGELGGQVESFENLSSGTLDMFITGYSIAGSQYGPVAFFDAPYLYGDYDEMLQRADPNHSDVANRVVENMAEETNIRTIGIGIMGTRRLTLSDQAVYHPDDLEGVKVRAVPDNLMFETVNGLGAEAVNIDWSELPSALSTGSVSGQENPYNIVWNSGIWESQSYLMETNHLDQTLPVYISEHVWGDMSTSNQDLLVESMLETQTKALDELRSSLEEYKQKMGEELEIIEESELDMDAFRTSVRSRIREQFDSDAIELIETIHGGDYE